MCIFLQLNIFYNKIYFIGFDHKLKLNLKAYGIRRTTRPTHLQWKNKSGQFLHSSLFFTEREDNKYFTHLRYCSKLDLLDMLATLAAPFEMELAVCDLQ